VKKALYVLGALLVLVILAGAGLYAWASSAAKGKLARTFTTHTVDFPIPFPLSAEEVRRRRLNPEAAARVAREEALERGRHLIESRYACVECHGDDFSGGVMVDAPPIGRMHGPNLTGGEGSRVAAFGPAEWDRIVRHGILLGGAPALMPSMDFQLMSDQELSDIIVFIRSQPPMNHTTPPVTLGPVGKWLVASGKMRASAEVIPSHDAPHNPYPPPTAASLDFGRHLAGICTGCHRSDLAGGPIVGGDPSWPPARNLTPHQTGLANWTPEQFVAAMREARRPDGSALQPPMSGMPKYAQKMLDVELEALWLYLRSVPPVPSRE
jgi:mono/diheme cytochrome c family protein